MTGNEFEMRCPQCGSDCDIHITFTGTCKLVPDGTEDCGDHEWSDASPARCDACNYAGTVKDFNQEDA